LGVKVFFAYEIQLPKSDFARVLLARPRLKFLPHLFHPRQDRLSPLFALHGREELQQPRAVQGEGFVCDKLIAEIIPLGMECL
jgi:hypothetical protein